ncbi:hypothetical protein [Bdellovibrio reynosensis]|uniref:Uncharacterized protein n=1 Tax=Bdellovibrio reynosensis TaxID=2835041 RepID=A0ABY4CCJ7_9BACT|nr:hypothetical protein [Bdellovibrio reynosensis]UOE99919.1 hypothetical protein MNR06_09435 [Bdellovibrio reynosensis]
MNLSGEALVQSALRFLGVDGVTTNQMGWLDLLLTSLENFFGRGVGFASQTFSSIFKTGGFHE